MHYLRSPQAHVDIVNFQTSLQITISKQSQAEVDV